MAQRVYNKHHQQPEIVKPVWTKIICQEDPLQCWLYQKGLCIMRPICKAHANELRRVKSERAAD